MLLGCNIQVCVYGIVNSCKLLLNSQGIDLVGDWKVELVDVQDQFFVECLYDFVNSNVLVNLVIVDCISNVSIVSQYVDMMENGFYVVMLNKKVNIDMLVYYKKLCNIVL